MRKALPSFFIVVVYAWYIRNYEGPKHKPSVIIGREINGKEGYDATGEQKNEGYRGPGHMKLD